MDKLTESKLMEVQEQSIDLLTSHRREMAIWLAVEVLMMDEIVGERAPLVDQLVILQEELEQDMRRKPPMGMS
jgi:ribulose kinase